MEQILDFFQKLFQAECWPLRWHCGKWTEFHGWLYIFSDLAIWVAYFAIPILLIKFATKKRYIPLPSIFWLFGAFILLCGLTHLLDATMFWWPAYRLNGLIRFATAIVSWVTVFSFIKILPKAFAMKTSKEYELEIIARKKIEDAFQASEQKFRIILESAPDAMVIVDDKGKIVLTNKQAEKLFGYTKEEFVGNTVEMLIPKRFQEKHISLRETYIQTPVTREMGIGLDLYGKRKDATEFMAEISLSPLQTADGLWVSSVIRDITERKKAEQKLIEYTIELERKNIEIEQFAFLTSHDLQEPLRTVSNYVNLFEKQYKNKFDKDSDEYLHYITEATKRMQLLINDLLEYSRIGHEKNIIEVDCNKVIEEVLKDMDASIKESKAEIKSVQLPTIKGYAELKSLFQNLISNAIKFRKKDTQLIINITVQPKDEEWLFAVKDNGIGIDKTYHGKLFKIFQRLHSQQEYQGTGIGLAQCKKIVELHGGKIWIESELEKGSTFYFTISKSITQ